MANCNFAICWWGLRFVKKAAGPWLAHLRYSAVPAGGGGASIPTHCPHRQIVVSREAAGCGHSRSLHYSHSILVTF